MNKKQGEKLELAVGRNLCYNPRMIYFVGAGSGAADLITVRGMRLLQKADLLVWAGSLVNPELLEYCKSGCEILDSSKMTLEETTQALASAEKDGKVAVRLHTGDPSIYGSIREQIEELKKIGLEYSVVPGVSAFLAAAAALNAEYTVPEISQTLIISRMEGRTPVPENERIENLSKIGSSLVLFLSTGMIDSLAEKLTGPGSRYTKESPVAVVYKASWRNQKIVRGTLADIAQKVREAGIRKTALVLVGDFLGADYNKSCLYDKDFTTEYRKASGTQNLDFQKIAVICYSESEMAAAERLFALVKELALCGADLELCKCFGINHERAEEIFGRLFDSSHAGQKTLILSVGAAAIAVRASAGFLVGKDSDPAVVAFDGKLRFAVPIIGGHLGGANFAANIIARKIGAEAVITTATDSCGKWAVDSWAAQNGFKIKNIAAVKNISSRVLQNEKISCFAPEEISQRICERLKESLAPVKMTGSIENADFVVSFRKSDFEKCENLGGRERLFLIPPCLNLGLGCKKGSDSKKMENFVKSQLDSGGFFEEAVCSISSIDLKKGENAILDLAKNFKVRTHFFTAEELNAVAGDFSKSDFVKGVTGTDNVCERSALALGGKLLVKKTAADGMTFALAVKL